MSQNPSSEWEMCISRVWCTITATCVINRILHKSLAPLNVFVLLPRHWFIFRLDVNGKRECAEAYSSHNSTGNVRQTGAMFESASSVSARLIQLTYHDYCFTIGSFRRHFSSQRDLGWVQDPAQCSKLWTSGIKPTTFHGGSGSTEPLHHYTTLINICIYFV